MTMLAWLVPIAALAFLVWCAYDCGVDAGYERCWDEHRRAERQEPT